MNTYIHSVRARVKSNIIHHDFNPCGGGERVSFATMQAISDMGIDFDITTYSEPNLSKSVNTYGKDLVSVIKKAKKVEIVSSFNETNNKAKKDQYDIYINTHPDLLPYYQDHFSSDNAIVYCHFPMANQYIKSRNLEYIRKDLRIIDQDGHRRTKSSTDSENVEQDICFKGVEQCYKNLMINSTIITNSEFSRGSILKIFNGEIKKVHVIRPPVDTETLRNTVLLSSSEEEREDVILVISRINKQKEIENAIMLAKLLKRDAIGIGMIIVGNIDYTNDLGYYLSLRKMVKDFDLEDYVIFQTNVSFESLLSIMKKTKIYFHPMVGEHFGMAVVEAMAAGLVPIVPDVGGPTEYVPKKYHFQTLEEAVDKIASSLSVSSRERIKMSNVVRDFSLSNYITSFQKVIQKLLR
jgi:glycosyltransferase involved in cell wall biosynthesis